MESTQGEILAPSGGTENQMQDTKAVNSTAQQNETDQNQITEKGNGDVLPKEEEDKQSDGNLEIAGI